jgi:hypothetical protein
MFKTRITSIWIPELLAAVTDLQCQVRVGHKRENFNADCYIAYYNTTTLCWYYETNHCVV